MDYFTVHPFVPLQVGTLSASAIVPQLLISVFLAYHVLTIFYNITLHPLARVPGYKLAGMSRLYQTYWCYRNGRSMYYLKVQEMHEEFGPIVRVNPNEVSLRDPQDFEKVYTIRSKYAKDPLFYRTMGVLKGMFGTFDNELHRARRQPWVTHFSKTAVAGLGSTIEDKVATLHRRAEEELEATGLVPIQGLLHALMIDVVSEYTLPSSMGMLDQRPYATVYASDLLNQAGFIWIMMINNSLYHVIQVILTIFSKVFGSRSEFDRLLEKCTLVVDAIFHPNPKNSFELATAKPIVQSVMGNCVDEKTKVPSVTKHVLIDELYSFNLAAAFNFGTGMSVTIYHILSNKEIAERLHAEIKAAFPSPLDHITHAAAEKLPYLTACLQEGNRLGYGPIGRLPRIVPAGGETFQGYHVPAGCTVGTWSYVQHHNADIWGPDHETFNPDRWLDADRARYMSKYLLTFGKDSRYCIGKELALATMYVCLANFIQRFGTGLQVHGTYPVNDLNDNFATVIPPNAPRLTLEKDAAVQVPDAGGSGYMLTVR